MSIDFRETSIKAVSEDIDGNTIYIGNGSGDLASFDMRTGTWVSSSGVMMSACRTFYIYVFNISFLFEKKMFFQTSPIIAYLFINILRMNAVYEYN